MIRQHKEAAINQTRMIRHPLLPFLEIKSGAEDTYSVRRHSHERLSVGFVERGSSRISCEHLAFNLACHDAILIPPRAVHLCQPEQADRFKFRMLFLASEWVRQACDLDPFKLSPATARLSPDDQTEKAGFFALLETGMTSGEPDPLKAEETAVLFIGRLLTSLFRVAPGKDKPPPARGKTDQAMAFLDAHFTEDIRLSDLEAACGQSRFTLVRQFRNYLGLTPHAYLVNKRINLAKERLRQRHSVADTAAFCGFFDQSHFVKTFKNYTGLTPSRFLD